jgi:hypothetical protein
MEINREVPTDLNDLCMRLLRRDPKDRPTGRDILLTMLTWLVFFST